MYKDPVTDHGKMSRKGRMTLELDGNGQYITRTEGTGDPDKVAVAERLTGHSVFSEMCCYCLSYVCTHNCTLCIQDLLVTVFENGELAKEYSFDEIRERAEIQLVREQRLKP